MAVDRVSRVKVSFIDTENGDYVEVTYHMESGNTVLNSNNPQGKILGTLDLKGEFFATDVKRGNSKKDANG